MVRFSLWHVTLLFWAVLCACVPAALGSDCDVASVVVMGDGRCDEEYNTQACGYDGGDCCECTCWDNEFSCGVMGYSCIDPVAPCSIPGLVFRDLEESSGSDSPTSSPTPSPTAGPVADKRDSDAGETASTSNDSSSSTTTGVIVGVSAAVVVIGVGMYFYKKKRSSGRYDATSDYAAAGHLT